MILVTGATGQFGGKAIDHLLKKGINPSQISALVRDPEKAKGLKEKGIDVRVGDYKDHASLLRVFKGIDKLLLVSSNDRSAVENRTAHHINAIKAAKEAGVNHVIYTSFVRKPNFENSAIAAFQNSHVQSEEFLKNSGIYYTILQNGIYLEMLPIFAGSKVTENGIILFPAADGKASFVLREELAEAAAHVLTTGGHEMQVYQLTNTASVSFNDVARAITDVIDREVVYQSPSIEGFEAMMRQFAVPDLYIGMFSMWGLALSQRTMDVEDNTLAKFLGKQPTSMQQFIKNVYG